MTFLRAAFFCGLGSGQLMGWLFVVWEVDSLWAGFLWSGMRTAYGLACWIKYAIASSSDSVRSSRIRSAFSLSCGYPYRPE